MEKVMKGHFMIANRLERTSHNRKQITEHQEELCIWIIVNHLEHTSPSPLYCIWFRTFLVSAGQCAWARLRLPNGTHCVFMLEATQLSSRHPHLKTRKFGLMEKKGDGTNVDLETQIPGWWMVTVVTFLRVLAPVFIIGVSHRTINERLSEQPFAWWPWPVGLVDALTCENRWWAD